MTTAVGFTTIGHFPYCMGPSSRGTPYSYINGLTLSQAMQFYWNLETFTITTTGSASSQPAPPGTIYTGTMNGSINVSPLAITGDLSGMDVYAQNEGMAFPYSGSSISLGIQTKQPNQRVCYPSFTAPFYPLWMEFFLSTYSSSFETDMQLTFAVEEDSTNSALYSIRYYFFIKYPTRNGAGFGDSVTFSSNSFSAPATLASGTFSISGITFPWYCGWSQAAPKIMIASGLSLSATSTSFTY